MTKEEKYMQDAIEMAMQGMQKNEGGPFGCIVVKDGEIIGRGNNKVTSSNDPTAHAEVVAIRQACQHIHHYQLDECEVYTTCEPCPMCLGALYWARPKIIYYGNTRADAAQIGFDDSLIYEEVDKQPEQRIIPMRPLLRNEALKLFEAWTSKTDKTMY